jgi:Mn2+/Fe2+ NRAMP family transporter
MKDDAADSNISVREKIEPPPSGWDRFRWFGPGLLWMVASVGSGSVLFTPRIGSRYRLQLLWIALLGAFLTWVIIREIGRYTVVTGKTILDGYREVPGPWGWAVWLILVPGLASGIVMVAGLSGLAGSALMIALPGSQLFYGLLIMIVSAVLVVTGKYKGLERIASMMALLLVASGVITAIVVFPEWNRVVTGLIPQIPSDFDPYFVLPWVGFLLAGSAGVMWFSYWVTARGFGGEIEGQTEAGDKKQNDEPHQTEPDTRQRWLRSWLITMGATALIGIVGGTIINISFLSLGAELLAPKGIVPEGIAVAEDLAKLLSEVWGRPGFWLLIVTITLALWGSILANQDGWSRMYADGTRMLLKRNQTRSLQSSENAAVFKQKLGKLITSRLLLKNTYVLAVLTAVPVILFLSIRDPVAILSIGGIISAAHMPVVVLLTLYLNLRHLPEGLRPGLVWSIIMVLVGIYYSFFAGFYFYDFLFGQGSMQ